jgi:tetratricopeptide (TPR) repeat protein
MIITYSEDLNFCITINLFTRNKYSNLRFYNDVYIMTANEKLILEKVLSKKCILFLGAGASYGSLLKNGESSPLGNQLSQKIFNHFYPNDKYESESLQSVSSMVSAKNGSEVLHNYLYDIFNGIKPNNGLIALSQLKWKAIYTTNIEEAIENAYKFETNKGQKILPVVGSMDKASENINLEVPLYKLHGCVNRKDVPLVFSLEEYATHKEEHLKLFEKLSVDLIEYPVIFIGYSMIDSNFQQLWATVTKYCKTTTLNDRYYFVSPNIKQSQLEYLESKGFTCFNMGIDEFGKFLLNNTRNERQSLDQFYTDNTLPLELFSQCTLSNEEKYELSNEYKFPLIEIKKPANKNSGFYKGGEPDWGDLKNQLDGKRDLLDLMLEDFSNWYSKPSLDFWVITGRAGDGKSTLLKRFAIEIAQKIGENVLFASHRSNLNPQKIIDLAESTKQPLIVIIDNVVDREIKVNKLINFLKTNKTKVLIVGAARISDWHLGNKDFFLKPKEHRLEKLSDNEIKNILLKLSENNALGYLNEVTEKERITLFKDKSDRELLVALRELTENENFDQIIVNEYSNIQSELAQTAYFHICLINQLRYKIPMSLLMRVLGLDYNTVHNQVFQYTEGIIYFDDTADGTDFLLRARHSIIAGIVSRIYFKDDLKKFQFIIDLVNESIPSNPLESSMLKKLYHHSTIKLLFSDVSVGIKCYDKIIEEFPDDYFILQQKSLFLTNYTDKFSLAKESIRKAIKISPDSFILKNTEGTIILKESLEEDDYNKSIYLLNEGKKLLTETIRKSFGNNPYHYHSLISHLISWYKKFEGKNLNLLLEIQSLIEESAKKHPNDTLLLTEAGKLNELFEKTEDAKDYFFQALSINERNSSARYLLAKILYKNGQKDEALKLCEDGYNLNPDEILLNRLRFELMHNLGFSKDDIKDSYIKLFSLVKNDYYLKACCAAFLYVNSDSYCDKIYTELRNTSSISSEEKYKVIYQLPKIICAESFEENGSIVKIQPTGYNVKTDRFNCKTTAYLRSKKRLNERTKIKYKLSFNYLGPVIFKFTEI